MCRDRHRRGDGIGITGLAGALGTLAAAHSFDRVCMAARFTASAYRGYFQTLPFPGVWREAAGSPVLGPVIETHGLRPSSCPFFDYPSAMRAQPTSGDLRRRQGHHPDKPHNLTAPMPCRAHAPDLTRPGGTPDVTLTTRNSLAPGRTCLAPQLRIVAGLVAFSVVGCLSQNRSGSKMPSPRTSNIPGQSRRPGRYRPDRGSSFCCCPCGWAARSSRSFQCLGPVRRRGIWSLFRRGIGGVVRSRHPPRI